MPFDTLITDREPIVFLERSKIEVWIGEISIRIFNKIKQLLLVDKTSKSIICKLGKTINTSDFYLLNDGNDNEISFFEIYKNKNLTKNQK